MVPMLCSALMGCPATASRVTAIPASGARNVKRAPAPPAAIPIDAVCSLSARASASSDCASASAFIASCSLDSPSARSAFKRSAFARAAFALARVEAYADRIFPSSGTRTRARTSPFFTGVPSLKATCSTSPATGEATRAVLSGSDATSPGRSSAPTRTSIATSAVLIFASPMTFAETRTVLRVSRASPDVAGFGAPSGPGFDRAQAPTRSAAHDK